MTLLEVMVALVLLAILGVMASKGLAQVIAARNVVFSEQTRWRNMAMVWARMGEDITYSVDGIPMEPPQTHWRGNGSTATWAVWSHAGGVLPVQYLLREGVLLRILGADLSRPGSVDAAAERNGATAKNLETPLINGIRSMGLSFMDQKGQWYDHWPLEGAIYTRPNALRIVLAQEGGRDVTRIFSLP